MKHTALRESVITCSVKIISILIESIWFIKWIFLLEQRQCGSECDNCAATWQHTATSGPPLYLGCPIGSAEPNPKVICEHGSFPLSLSINLSSYFPSFAPAVVSSFCAAPFRAQRVHISDGIIYQLIQSFCSWPAGLLAWSHSFLSISVSAVTLTLPWSLSQCFPLLLHFYFWKTWNHKQLHMCTHTCAHTHTRPWFTWIHRRTR